MSQQTTVISREGDTISAIAYRYYGTSRGKVEAVLKANKNLCRYPAVLPIGVIITLPAIANEVEQINVIKTVNLWD